ncbi:MAG: sulfatase [Kiritimatiellae bacterium]|jgi:iduronate 2-sulfatase|nr:sulfatase [Kiritimatiellia bacterium]
MNHFKIILTILLLGCIGLTENALAMGTKPNVLLICIDDLRPELNCFGKNYIKSPNIDKLASQGRAFKSHYVQSPTCGASRFTLLTGCYGSSNNGALFNRAKAIKAGKKVPPSMPEWFRKNGYTTVSVGKVSHHPGGRGGKNWNSDSEIEMPDAWDRHLLPVREWQHPRGIMHGLANGEIRVKAGDMDVFQSKEGPDDIYPDGWITDEALKQMDILTEKDPKPFFLAVGLLKPHLPFGAPAKYYAPYKNITLPPTLNPEKPDWKSTWHASGEFMNYNRWGKDPNKDPAFAIDVRKHYAACVSYSDAQVGKILAKLKASGQANNTIIVLWGDHGWNLGEHAIWGKHNLFEEALRSPLIITYPQMKEPGKSTDAVVETLDIFPTLCELTKLPQPDFTAGTSLVPMLKNSEIKGHPAYSYWAKKQSIRTATHRMILYKDGYAELYDHTSKEKESKNISKENPELVKQLSSMIKARL